MINDYNTAILNIYYITNAMYKIIYNIEVNFYFYLTCINIDIF